MNAPGGDINLDLIQPVVLTGGSSRRYGTDKLRLPLPEGGMLVDRPIRALREVFGPRVKVVGACHPEVAARGDGVIADPRPGVGPAGGILAALEASGTDVFVLPGDVPRIRPATVRVMLAALSGVGPEVWCVVGETAGPEPCIGVYRPGAAALLRVCLAAGAGRLRDAFPDLRRVLVPISVEDASNLNVPGDCAYLNPVNPGKTGNDLV
ncbi:MAG: molybdenum cofactor guanylyltransferase [Phycisphaerales bacterium]|nr:molybdenum cofactor guanylyltransferase [Phycisphaerales bacterium]